MDAKTQVEAARGAVLALPSPDLATLEVTGRDRVSWLNGLLTCDLAKREPGQVAYGLAVARSGRVLADAIVVADEVGDSAESVLAAVTSSGAQALRAHLEHYLVMEDAEISEKLDGYEAWALHGPRSREVLDAARAAGARGGVIDRTGLGGASSCSRRESARQGFAPRSRAPQKQRRGSWATIAGGRRYGWSGLSSSVSTSTTRLTRKRHRSRAAVSFNKGCYLGQEVVCMLELRGHVKRKLVPLVIEGHAPAPAGAAVTDAGGATVGEVTSSALSPTLGKAVALAMIKRAFSAPGNALLVTGAPAVVVEQPA